jgi:ribosomal subunit interface protein
MYYEIRTKDVELTDAIRALVHQKLEPLEHFLSDYPPESVMATVKLYKIPMNDEYYDVRVALQLPGDQILASEKAAVMETALVAVQKELEGQLEQLISAKRNESHWKRHRRPSETVRRTVPVDTDELSDISDEVRNRTEQKEHHEGPRKKVA